MAEITHRAERSHRMVIRGGDSFIGFPNGGPSGK
jgi:hypothetical protein